MVGVEDRRLSHLGSGENFIRGDSDIVNESLFAPTAVIDGNDYDDAVIATALTLLRYDG